MSYENLFEKQLTVHPEYGQTDSDVYYEYDPEFATELANAAFVRVVGLAAQAGVDLSTDGQEFKFLTASHDMSRFSKIRVSGYSPVAGESAYERGFEIVDDRGFEAYGFIRLVPNPELGPNIYVYSEPSLVKLGLGYTADVIIRRNEYIRVFGPPESVLNADAIKTVLKEYMAATDCTVVDYMTLVDRWLTDEYALERHFGRKRYYVDQKMGLVLVYPDQMNIAYPGQRVEVLAYPLKGLVSEARESIRSIRNPSDMIQHLKQLAPKPV